MIHSTKHLRKQYRTHTFHKIDIYIFKCKYNYTNAVQLLNYTANSKYTYKNSIMIIKRSSNGCQSSHDHILAEIIIIIIRDENISVHKMNASLERIRAVRAYLHPSTMLPAAMASRACNIQCVVTMA